MVNDLSLTSVSFVLNFIRFLSEIHGMSQNSRNSKRVIQKTNFNMKFETLTVQVDISHPLDTFPPKNKSFSTKLFNGKRIGQMKRNKGWDKDIKDRNEVIPRVGIIIA